MSRVVLSWVLSRGDRAASWEYFEYALASDIDDIQGGTTRKGIHVGAMAGTVDLLQRCYTGIETRDDVLWLGPRLPTELRSLHFSILYRHHPLEIDITHERARVSRAGHDVAPIRVGFRGDAVALSAGETIEFALHEGDRLDRPIT